MVVWPTLQQPRVCKATEKGARNLRRFVVTQSPIIIIIIKHLVWTCNLMNNKYNNNNNELNSWKFHGATLQLRNRTQSNLYIVIIFKCQWIFSQGSDLLSLNKIKMIFCHPNRIIHEPENSKDNLRFGEVLHNLPMNNHVDI